MVTIPILTLVYIILGTLLAGLIVGVLFHVQIENARNKAKEEAKAEFNNLFTGLKTEWNNGANIIRTDSNNIIGKVADSIESLHNKVDSMKINYPAPSIPLPFSTFTHNTPSTMTVPPITFTSQSFDQNSTSTAQVDTNNPAPEQTNP